MTQSGRLLPLHHRGEHGIPILTALALLDPQRHARAVDVPDFERDDFAGAKSGAISDRQRRLMLQVASRADQRAHLLTAQDDR